MFPFCFIHTTKICLSCKLIMAVPFPLNDSSSNNPSTNRAASALSAQSRNVLAFQPPDEHLCLLFFVRCHDYFTFGDRPIFSTFAFMDIYLRFPIIFLCRLNNTKKNLVSWVSILNQAGWRSLQSSNLGRPRRRPR